MDDQQLAADFILLWQSELTAMTADRELREFWAVLLALWANAATAASAVSRMPPFLRHDHAAGNAPGPEPARPAPVAAASRPGNDPGDGEVEQLRQRVARLEQLLAGYMADPGTTGSSGG